MGRPSKLTDKQWEQVGKRLLQGEKPAALAREFGVGRATISERFSERVGKVRTVAKQLVETRDALDSLSVSEQLSAISLADDLWAISSHLASAAKFGAATSHRLAGIAHGKVQEIDDAAPLDEKSFESLKGVSVLTKMANEASFIAVNLLAANKDMVKGLQQEDPVQPVRIVVQVEDASQPEPAA